MNQRGTHRRFVAFEVRSEYRVVERAAKIKSFEYLNMISHLRHPLGTHK